MSVPTLTMRFEDPQDVGDLPVANLPFTQGSIEQTIAAIQKKHDAYQKQRREICIGITAIACAIILLSLGNAAIFVNFFNKTTKIAIAASCIFGTFVGIYFYPTSMKLDTIAVIENHEGTVKGINQLLDDLETKTKNHFILVMKKVVVPDTSSLDAPRTIVVKYEKEFTLSGGKVSFFRRTPFVVKYNLSPYD